MPAQTQFSPQKKGSFNPALIMAFIAISLGIASAIGISKYFSTTQQKIKSLSITKKVYVTNKELKVGSKITEADLTIKDVPAQSVPSDYPNSIDAIKNREVAVAIPLGELITEGKLASLGVTSGLNSIIPDGMRAFTIRANDLISLGNNVRPGDRVDVLTIYKDKQNTLCRSVFQNLLVLAAGDKLYDPKSYGKTDSANAKAGPVNIITLAVTPLDAEKLFLVTTNGQIQLSLRKFGDKNVFDSEGIDSDLLYKGDLAVTHEKENKKDNKPIISSVYHQPNTNIELIFGNVRTYKSF